MGPDPDETDHQNPDSYFDKVPQALHRSGL